MTKNTALSLGLLVFSILTLISPLFIIPFAIGLLLYVSLSLVFGESALENTTTGEPTTLGWVLWAGFILFLLTPLLIALYSLVREKLSHGKMTPVLTLWAWLKSKRTKYIYIIYGLSAWMITVSLISFISPGVEQVGANIGGGVLLLGGLSLLAFGILYTIIVKKITKQLSALNFIKRND